MRVALLTRSCPVAAADGVARRRHVLAKRLAALGHDVHLFSIGERSWRTRHDGATLHVGQRPLYPNPWFGDVPGLDWPLTDSQLLWELLSREHGRDAFDVIDAPLALAQGVVTVARSQVPVVLGLDGLAGEALLGRTTPTTSDDAHVLSLGRLALGGASLVLAESRASADGVARRHGIGLLAERLAVVPPGLPDSPDCKPLDRVGADQIAVLVTGLEVCERLPECLAALSRLVARVPALRVTLLGAPGFTSAGHEVPRMPALMSPDSTVPAGLPERLVLIEAAGAAQVSRAFAAADLVVVAGRIGSPGIVHVDALRAGVPAVAFDAPHAREFHGDETARFVAGASADELCDAVAHLAHDQPARRAMAVAARRRFESSFTVELMAERTVAAYERAQEVSSGTSRVRAVAPPRIFQITEDLHLPDGVSQIVLGQAEALMSRGGVAAVQTLRVQPTLASRTGRVAATPFRAVDVAVLHVRGYSRLEALFESVTAQRVVHYHVITPPRFFRPSSVAFEMATRGLCQLPRLVGQADVLTGDSWFGVREAAVHLPRERPTLCVYPAVDASALVEAPFNGGWLAAAQARKDAAGEIVLVFAGRVVPHKRHDLVARSAVRLAEALGRRVRVLLVGDPATDVQVAASVERAVRNATGVAIEWLGPTGDAMKWACYRLADAYVSASEHEGFGTPLVEAMAFDVPVVAAAHGAIPETLGESGIAIPRWNDVAVADAIARLVTDEAHRAATIAQQRRNLERFSRAALERRLDTLIALLNAGRDGASDVTRGSIPSGGCGMAG